MYRQFAIVVAVLVGLSSPLSAQKPDLDVEALTREYEQAVNRGDAKALAALHTTNAIRIGADGQLLTGRAAIEKSLAAGFSGPMKGAKLTLRSGRAEQVTSDVRVIEGTYEFSAPGMGSLRGKYVNTVVREGGQWRLASVAAVPDSPGTQKPVPTGTKPGAGSK